MRTAVLVTLIGAQLLAAQTPSRIAEETERARQLLSSNRLVDKAWGAHLASGLGSEELNALIVEQFRTAVALRDFPGSTDEYVFLTVLFDAAIEAGVAVPAELLEPYKDRWVSPVVILAARSKDKASEDLLLSLRSSSFWDMVWLASNNVLLQMRSQAWYEALLSEISIRHRFTVTDPRSGGSASGTGGGGCGDGVFRMPKDFPPTRLYELQDHGEPGNVFLAKGPRSTYYKRTSLPPSRQVGIGSCNSQVNRDEMRIDYLDELRVASPHDTRKIFWSESTVLFGGVETFVSTANLRMEEQERTIRQVLQAVERAGMRTPAVQLRIVPSVIDRREDRSIPLPAIAPREIDVTAGSASEGSPTPR